MSLKYKPQPAVAGGHVRHGQAVRIRDFWPRRRLARFGVKRLGFSGVSVDGVDGFYGV